MSNSSGSGLIIDTPPSVTQCQNTTITWYGGVGKLPSSVARRLHATTVLNGAEPFYVGYIASGTVGTTSTYVSSPTAAQPRGIH